MLKWPSTRRLFIIGLLQSSNHICRLYAFCHIIRKMLFLDATNFIWGIAVALTLEHATPTIRARHEKRDLSSMITAARMAPLTEMLIMAGGRAQGHTLPLYKAAPGCGSMPPLAPRPSADRRLWMACRERAAYASCRASQQALPLLPS